MSASKINKYCSSQECIFEDLCSDLGLNSLKLRDCDLFSHILRGEIFYLVNKYFTIETVFLALSPSIKGNPLCVLQVGQRNLIDSNLENILKIHNYVAEIVGWSGGQLGV